MMPDHKISGSVGKSYFRGYVLLKERNGFVRIDSLLRITGTYVGPHPFDLRSDSFVILFSRLGGAPMEDGTVDLVEVGAADNHPRD
ncbi:hypothetical protein Trydic_g11901 [Trypoxylus dichotomus]